MFVIYIEAISVLNSRKAVKASSHPAGQQVCPPPPVLNSRMAIKASSHPAGQQVCTFLMHEVSRQV